MSNEVVGIPEDEMIDVVWVGNRKPGTGLLARNKQKAEWTQAQDDGKGNTPDFKGMCVLGFTVYSISGWIKDGRYGKFLSLKFDDIGIWAPPDMYKQKPEDPEIGF